MSRIERFIPSGVSKRQLATSAFALGEAGRDACPDSEWFGVRLGAVDLETRVSQYFELLREPLFRYLLAAFGNPANAEELVQEVFLRLYRSLHAGENITNVRGWTFRVAHNLALDRRKSERYVDIVDGPTWDDLSRLHADAGPTPEQGLLQLEESEQLLRALHRLTEHERQCLHLRAEGLRHREIADVLGVSSSTVSDSLQRGIRKLAREIERTS